MCAPFFLFLGLYWWSKRPIERTTNDLHILWFSICRHPSPFFSPCVHPCICCTKKSSTALSLDKRMGAYLRFVCAFLSCLVQPIDLPACYIHTYIHSRHFFFCTGPCVLTTTFSAFFFFLLLFHIIFFFFVGLTYYDFSFLLPRPLTLVPCPLPIDH